MKKYKKVLGIITVVAAIPLMAAENSTIIKVNTYADEDLDNDLCSLREVIYAELSGDFPLGDSRQPTYKSLRPFDLVS
ncbi:CSLREA domain-containing protein [Acinetobacter baumannii]